MILTHRPPGGGPFGARDRRYARVLPVGSPLRAQWLPDSPLEPIDLKALWESHGAPERGEFRLVLGELIKTSWIGAWGAFGEGGRPARGVHASYRFGPDTEEWPVWNLRVPDEASYRLYLRDFEGNKTQLPTPRRR